MAKSGTAAFRALPDGWSATEIGGAVGGGSEYRSSSFLVAGAGRGISEVSDQFTYVYQRVDDDVDLVARVASLERIHPWAAAGVMIRASLADNAAHASMLVTAAKGMEFVRRPAAELPTLRTPAGGEAAPIWLKLERRGSSLTAFKSSDGVNWTLIANEAFDLPDEFYVGFVVTSRIPRAAATAVFDGVELVTSNLNPTVFLASPEHGGLFPAGRDIRVSVAGSDPDGTVVAVDLYVGKRLLSSGESLPFVFTWRPDAPGTYSLKAIATDDDGASTVSSAHTVTVVPAALSLSAVFEPSFDHYARTDYYVLEVYPAGSDRVVLAVNLGRPLVVSGECRVDVSAAVESLAPGRYVAVVKAVNVFGSAASAPSSTFIR